MTLTVYHLKNCDTCKKAIKALNDAGKSLSLVDVRENGIQKSELARLVNEVGFDVMLNTRSTTWRGLESEEKSEMTAQKALDLMSKYPTLIKRPVIDDGKLVTVGWDKKTAALRTV
jgi:arsenate reductase